MGLLPDLPALPPTLLRDLRAEPTYALETLALAAVDVHGPAAQEWAAEQRSRGRSPDAAAKSARSRFRRIARAEGAALGFGGVMTIAPDVAALVWILTREVLFISAAYGNDPTERVRAAEMLVILEVYDTVEEAVAGLDRQGERLAVALARQQFDRRMSGRSQRAMSRRVMRYASKRMAKRWGGRLVPGLGALIGSIGNAAAARKAGRDAIAFYQRR